MIGDQGRKKADKRSKAKFTSRGRRFVEGVACGLSQFAAARNAGYSLSIASHPKRLWKQASIQAHFEKIARNALPPQRVVKILDALLEGTSVTTQLKKERLVDAAGKPVLGDDGKAQLQIVSVTMTKTIDRRVQLRTLEMVVQYGGLIPSSIRAQVTSPAPLDEVLARAERERIQHEAQLIPSWMRQ